MYLPDKQQLGPPGVEGLGLSVRTRCLAVLVDPRSVTKVLTESLLNIKWARHVEGTKA